MNLVSKKSQDSQDIPRGGINDAVPGAAFPATRTAGWGKPHLTSKMAHN